MSLSEDSIPGVAWPVMCLRCSLAASLYPSSVLFARVREGFWSFALRERFAVSIKMGANFRTAGFAVGSGCSGATSTPGFGELFPCVSNVRRSNLMCGAPCCRLPLLLLCVVSIGWGVNRLLGFGLSAASVEFPRDDLDDVSMGSGAKRRGAAWSSCCDFLSLEDLLDVSTGGGANLLVCICDKSPVSGSLLFRELVDVVSTGCGKNRLVLGAFKSPVSGSFLELLAEVSTGTGANLLTAGFSSCALFLSLEDFVLVSTGCGANRRGGGDDMSASGRSRAKSPV